MTFTGAICHRLPGGDLHTPAPIQLALAEARHAAGDHVGARAVILEAREYLQRMLERLADPDRCALYLQVPEHQRIMRLAEEWLA